MLFGHRSRPIFVLLLSQQFKSGDFVFMQDSAPCSAHRAKATQDDLRNVVPYLFCSGKDAAVTKHNGHQFSTFSVDHLLMLLCFIAVSIILLLFLTHFIIIFFILKPG